MGQFAEEPGKSKPLPGEAFKLCVGCKTDQDGVDGEYSLVLACEITSNTHGYWGLRLPDLTFFGINENREKMHDLTARTFRLYEQEIELSPFEDDIMHLHTRRARIEA